MSVQKKVFLPVSATNVIIFNEVTALSSLTLKDELLQFNDYFITRHAWVSQAELHDEHMSDCSVRRTADWIVRRITHTSTDLG